jgi:hypothetical protein
LNPVRAKLVNTLSELSSYPWSGHTYILGKKQNDWQEVDEVLCHFSSERKSAIRLYKQFIKDGWNMGTRNDLLGGGLVRSAGGQKGLRLLKKLKKRWQYDSRILGDGDFVKDVLQGNDDIENQRFFIQQNYDTERIAKIICDKYEIDKSELFSGRRARYLTKPKGMFSFFSSEYLGLPLSVIGKKLKVSGVSAYNLKTIGKKAVQEEGNILIT